MQDLPIDEIKKIAADLHKCLIFTDRHITGDVAKKASDMQLVFMPLIFMKDADFEKIKNDPPGLIFEYYSKALPRGFNGMPMFTSCRMLSQADAKRVFDLADKLEAAEKSILEAEGPGEGRE